MEQTRRARLTGLTAALLTVAAILWTLFASPSIGVVADGSYASAAEGLALRYAEESIPTGQRVEDFAYEDTAYSTLLFASRTSVGAAVALVRLATHPFGLGFSTRYLAVVYALLMGWGAYLLANGLARRSRTAAILATLGLPLALANPAVIGYLNSLYAVGASMAYLLLFLGATVYCLCREKGCGVQWTLLVLFAAQLMLRTMAQMMVLLPAAVLAVVLCTGAINSVTPIALMMPAISSIKKWKGESLARMFFFKVYLRGHRLAGGRYGAFRRRELLGGLSRLSARIGEAGGDAGSPRLA